MVWNNKIAVKLGLENENPSANYNHPDADSLIAIGKKNQTIEIVKAALENETEKPILEYISKRLIDYDLCLAAVKKNGRNLSYVPEKYIDYKICKESVKNDGTMIAWVPKQMRTRQIYTLAVDSDWHKLAETPEKWKTKKMCESAIQKDPLAIKYVPSKYLNQKILLNAVKRSEAGYWRKRLYTKHEEFCFYKDWPIQYVPKELLSEEMVRESLRLCPRSIKVIPQSFIDKSVCIDVVKRDGGAYANLPEDYKYDSEIIDIAICSYPGAILDVPLKMRTLERCILAKEKDESISIKRFPEEFAETIKQHFANPNTLKTNKQIFLNAPPIKLEYKANTVNLPQIISKKNQLTIDEDNKLTISYISDIHLEHQLKNTKGKCIGDIYPKLEKKINEMISGENTHRILLIAGDVSDGFDHGRLFYSILKEKWNGSIISVLGNHDIWQYEYSNRKKVSYDSIVAAYREMIQENTNGSTWRKYIFLENSVYIRYKNKGTRIIDEKMILNASSEDLMDFFNKCTMIILGGLGFSGKNKVFNAKDGVYRNIITRSEDIRRSARFEKIYKKLLKCAGDKKVIVLTHNPIQDWTQLGPHRNWIYISGHTHQNVAYITENGAIMHSDNQMGYRPKKWGLKSFDITFQQKYNPFFGFQDGIHEITSEDVEDFYNYKGHFVSCKTKERIFLLLRNGIHMFVLKNDKGLYLLVGGTKKRLANSDINYYYNNLIEYYYKVKSAFTGYQKVIKKLSRDIKAIGGWGYIHGCIVDIDYYNHIYLDPISGTITPYFALSMTKKVFFSSVSSLLQESPYPPVNIEGIPLYNKYKKMVAAEKQLSLATAPVDDMTVSKEFQEYVEDTSIYKSSRVMKNVQYLQNDDIIRVWNEDVIPAGRTKISEKRNIKCNK